MKTLKTPLDPDELKNLRVKEAFRISGKVFTARDAAHKRLLAQKEKGEELPFDFSAFPCFHCGPVMAKSNDNWRVVSAGPTTSIRMEMFEKEFIEKLGTKMFIGKGGMGENTSKALKKHGGVYAQFTGGAGSLMAGSVKGVQEVYFLEELGVPEAVWVFEVDQFGPLLVTMDSTGDSIHRSLSNEVQKRLEKLLNSL